MSYRLDIKENSLAIQGLYGTYEAVDSGNGGFTIFVIQDTCVNELDAEGEEYLVESGQEWSCLLYTSSTIILTPIASDSADNADSQFTGRPSDCIFFVMLSGVLILEITLADFAPENSAANFARITALSLVFSIWRRCSP